jgi:hypothetical protein
MHCFAKMAYMPTSWLTVAMSTLKYSFILNQSKNYVRKKILVIYLVSSLFTY